MDGVHGKQSAVKSSASDAEIMHAGKFACTCISSVTLMVVNVSEFRSQDDTTLLTAVHKRNAATVSMLFSVENLLAVWKPLQTIFIHLHVARGAPR